MLGIFSPKIILNIFLYRANVIEFRPLLSKANTSSMYNLPKPRAASHVWLKLSYHPLLWWLWQGGCCRRIVTFTTGIQIHFKWIVVRSCVYISVSLAQFKFLHVQARETSNAVVLWALVTKMFLNHFLCNDAIRVILRCITSCCVRCNCRWITIAGDVAATSISVTNVPIL